jgi:hypothetical protein
MAECGYDLKDKCDDTVEYWVRTDKTISLVPLCNEHYEMLKAHPTVKIVEVKTDRERQIEVEVDKEMYEELDIKCHDYYWKCRYWNDGTELCLHYGEYCFIKRMEFDRIRKERIDRKMEEIA